MTTHIITKDYIKQFLPTNPIIVEAGAHIGRDTIKMNRTWPDAIIHAFEPVPELFEQLQKNTAQLTNVFCYPFALAATSGTALFNISHGVTGISSLLKPTEYFEQPYINFTQQMVKTVSLIDWATLYNISYIDFMWLDLQGYELELLKASIPFLPNIHVLLTEVSNIKRYQNDVHYTQLKEFLALHHFNLDTVAMGKKEWGNALFLHKDFKIKTQK